MHQDREVVLDSTLIGVYLMSSSRLPRGAGEDLT